MNDTVAADEAPTWSVANKCLPPEPGSDHTLPVFGKALAMIPFVAFCIRGLNNIVPYTVPLPFALINDGFE